MKLFDFLKRNTIGLFIETKRDGRGAFDNIKTDYVLSRSLYSSAPADSGVYSNYANYSLGNYSTKTYIDTFSWFIGLPEITAESDTFTADIQKYLTKNKNKLLAIYRQTMIDGKHFVWLRAEKNIKGKSIMQIKQIPLENVIEDDCIKDSLGNYTKFVIETVEKWKDKNIDKKATIKIELTAGKELITINGDLPPQYNSKHIENTNSLNFVPVYCLYNNKQTFLKDGIPEIAAAVPFILRYDATLRKLGKHIDEILDPKIQARVKNVSDFLKYSFGFTAEDLENINSGKQSIDITQFKAAILSGENDSVNFIQQPNNAESAISLLKLLHWIIIELTMPEYLYGTAMNSTNASVQEQSPVWAKKVEGRQGEYNDFYIWLSDVFYLFQNAINGRDIYSTDGGADDISIRWAELTVKDDVQVMNALSTFINAMDKAMIMGLVSPQSAFNTLKTFVSIPNDYEIEKEAAAKWIKLKINLEALQDRIRNGDIDAGDAIEDLFKEAD